MRLTLRLGQEVRTVDVNAGDGPFDALFWAIEQSTGINVVCRDFNVHSLTVGKEAQGEVTVSLERAGRIVNGNGADTDIVIASAKAYLNALNKLQFPDRVDPQGDV